jgi:hypothetical protein
LVFLALTLAVPIAGHQIGIASISAGSIAVIAGIAITCMGGLEVAKILRSKKTIHA